MKYAVALGEIGIEGEALLAQVRSFAGAGFGAMSFSPKQLMALTAKEQSELRACLDERKLQSTLHGSFNTAPSDLHDLAGLLAGGLVSVTFDPILHWTAAGYLYDTQQMCGYLAELDVDAVKYAFSYGIEDFPETAAAFRFYRENLAPLAATSRFGILVDVGHLNLSRRQYGYHTDVTTEEYFAGLPLPLLEVHLSDNHGKRDEHLPLGAGDIDFHAVARGLAQLGFDGLSTIEIVPSQHGGDYEQLLSQTLESLAFWRGMADAPGTQFGGHHT